MGFEDLFGGDLFGGGLFGGEGSQWQIMLPLLIFVIFTMFMKRRKTEGSNTEIASSLLIDILENLRIAESFGYHKKPKKFRVGSWQRNSSKVVFLGSKLQGDMAKVFDLAESFNQQIDRARKEKSDIYLSGIDVRRLEGPLAKGRDGLQEWLKANMQQAGPDAGRRGCMPGGLGM